MNKLYRLGGPSSVCQSASCTRPLCTLLHPAPSSANIPSPVLRLKSQDFLTAVEAAAGGKIPPGPFSEARKAYHLREPLWAEFLVRLHEDQDPRRSQGRTVFRHCAPINWDRDKERNKARRGISALSLLSAAVTPLLSRRRPCWQHHSDEPDTARLLSAQPSSQL